jgi:multidrug transporter EmrE-like cation transporter
VPVPTKQAPPPLRVDTARVVLVGIALWTVALVVLLFLGDRVDRMWTWTCLTAIGLGVLGLWIMKLQGQLPRHDRTGRG